MSYSTVYKDLLERQAELQRLGNMPEPTPQQLEAALRDEIGELNHELKPLWAWWKKPGGSNKVDPERVLSEAADVLHFLLLSELRSGWDGTGFVLEPVSGPQWEPLLAEPYRLLAGMADGHWDIQARKLCALVAHFGYTPDDLARAYWEKTEENLRRWKAVAQ